MTMPDTNWPPLQRSLARWARGTAYAFAAAASGGVLAVHPDPIVHAIGNGGLVVIGATGALASATALLATALHRWRIEWVAVWFIAAAFGAYNVIDWGIVLSGHYDRAAGAAALTVVLGLLLARAAELWVFSLTAISARRAAQRSRRRVNGAET